MDTETKKNAPAKEPQKPATHKEITFKKDHQLDGREVKANEKRSLPIKYADRLIALGIAQ